MAVKALAPAPPLEIPASLATEPIGHALAGSLRPGAPVGLGEIAGFVIVRVMRDERGEPWFAAEATYNGATRYAEAVWDLQKSRLADIGGPFRRIVTVSVHGTYA